GAAGRWSGPAMRIREFLDFTPLRVSLVLFAGAVIFALWALIGAFRRPSTDVAMPAGAARVAPLAQIALAAPADIDGAVEQDPFSPDRSAPDEPFHMPGEARASADASGVSSPKPKVLGTAIGPVGESFATAQLGDAVPRIVRVGDKLGSYTVTAIARGRVQFRTPD